MTHDLVRSLLFKVIVISILAILCSVLGTVCASAQGALEVTPDQVDMLFDKPYGSSYTKQIRITNRGNSTRVTLSSDTEVTPSSSRFELVSGDSRDIDINARSDTQEGPHYIYVTADGKTVRITVTVTYVAKLSVSPSSSINFGTVGSSVSSVQETITIREDLGYKAVNINVEQRSGNSWVKPSRNTGTVSKNNPVDITFTLTPGPPDYTRRDNKYTWKFAITSSNANTVTITLEADIMRPPKLGRLDDERLELKFNKPKGTVAIYNENIVLTVRNRGDERLDFSSSVSEQPDGGIIIGQPSGKGVIRSKKVNVPITIPYDTPEGTYQGKLRIDAGSAGHDTALITIKILWPVDFSISSSSSYFSSAPLAIDFNSLELKERDYDTKKLTLTLTELYGYRPVEHLRFSSSDEYRSWLKEERDFMDIPPGETVDVTLRIEPGLEAVPKHYSWKYYLSAREITAKRIDIQAKIVPMNIKEMTQRLESFKNSTLRMRYPSSKKTIVNSIELLETVEQSEIGEEDWQKIPVLIKGSLSLLAALNDSVVYCEIGNYGKGVENSWTAWVSTSRMGVNSELNNREMSGYAEGIAIGADETTTEVLTDEAKMLELRGWDIKKAVEHALPTNDISKLNEEENVLESALSYQYAATLYGLLNDKKKRLDCVYEETRMMDKHDELVSGATDLRIRAENIILDSNENDFYRLWDTYLLSNPYNYDTASGSYKTAEGYLEAAAKNYRFAGEPLMAGDTEKDLKELRGEWRHILSLFLVLCVVYGAVLIYVLSRIIRGTMAYMNDMHEREIGDVVVT
ncbi:MAG: hypothetical protein C5S38_08580 [Candidatus Methanophagaceae archaeon]|nr:MAG: hypothetical protein C5S38_08580 [Methanophagales archaeon]